MSFNAIEGYRCLTCDRMFWMYEDAIFHDTTTFDKLQETAGSHYTLVNSEGNGPFFTLSWFLGWTDYVASDDD